MLNTSLSTSHKNFDPVIFPILFVILFFEIDFIWYINTYESASINEKSLLCITNVDSCSSNGLFSNLPSLAVVIGITIKKSVNSCKTSAV